MQVGSFKFIARQIRNHHGRTSFMAVIFSMAYTHFHMLFTGLMGLLDRWSLLLSNWNLSRVVRMVRVKKIHPFMRQAIRNKWSKEAVKAQIHALIGADKDKLLGYAHMLLFVGSACAVCTKRSDSPEYRICKAGINVMDDIKASDSIKEIDRLSIHKAMDAAMQLIETTPE